MGYEYFYPKIGLSGIFGAASFLRIGFILKKYWSAIQFIRRHWMRAQKLTATLLHSSRDANVGMDHSAPGPPQ